MRLPWISIREHDRLMNLEHEWTMQQARNNMTYALRQAARDGYKKGVEDTRKKFETDNPTGEMK